MSRSQEFRDEFKNIVDTLGQQREEARVQMHLAGMEAKAEWEELETKWGHMMAMSKRFEAAAEDAGGDVAEALVELGHEIGKGYKRLKGLL